MVDPRELALLQKQVRETRERMEVLERRVIALTLVVATFAGGASGLFDTLVEVLSGR